ncbi:glycosyltransferase [uncultured Prochlorococcus sp.]|uniref:glycosyltransferase n=1 Tax=uncultured Prochlorococcus sp. TaxID=159733 RepID=UPI0025897503|nr:glycosyltransferase [uncultured Prochlorococcus sp.]
MSSLKGKKILVTIQELENKEHRGIASYTKSLIKALNKSEAEIWLLVSMDFKKLKFKNFNENFQNSLLSTFISDYLKKGVDYKYSLKRKSKYSIVSKIIFFYVNIFNTIFNTISFLKVGFSKKSYYSSDCLKVIFSNKRDNPYLKLERTSYLKYVKGFYLAPNIYENCKFSSLLPLKNKIKIDIENFDSIISSAPLNLYLNKKSKDRIFVQTIHDLIPLEYEPKKVMVNSFSRMLKSCVYSNNIFVSGISRNKFKYNMIPKISHTKNLKNNFLKDIVITQPPTLLFEETENHNIYENILNSINVKNKLPIKPFKYFLFNASIDSRKNVLLLVNAYQNSDLQKNGVSLVITGKLKNDEYSSKLKKIINKNPGIVLTDYISETLKSTLYLNALCLLSPSIIEGFGIPVLDACCLGLPCFASDCLSHKEILELYDFDSYLELYSTESEIKWTNVFLKKGFINILDVEEKRLSRIKRYKNISNKILDNFSNHLSKFYSEL